MGKILEKWIEPAADGDGYWVRALKEYGPTSVLAGQTQIIRLSWARKLENLLEEFPGLEVREECSDNLAAFMRPSPPDVPPPDFDPGYAGERWDDDY